MYYSCDYLDEEQTKCILNCNPAECLILDEENCECVPDPECFAERFCGSDVDDCKCEEEDGGSWCTALTGDSVKVWSRGKIERFIYEDIGSDYNPYFDRKRGYWTVYRLDHIYTETGLYEDKYSGFVTSWEFDNVIYPKKIIYKHIKSSQYPYYGYHEELYIEKLTPDSLILSYYNETKKAWLICVPAFESRNWYVTY